MNPNYHCCKGKKIRNVLACLLVLLLVFSLWVWDMPVAQAASGTISAGGTYDVGAYGNGATITINSGLSVTLINSSGITYTDLSIVCNAGVMLTLNGVKIDNGSSENARALSFSGENNQLILEGNSYLSSYDYLPGIQVENGTDLEISGEGAVEVFGGGGAAGIGSRYEHDAGVIVIAGGTIDVYGGADSAAIGSGYSGSCGEIVIEGGIITAYGGKYSRSAIGVGGEGSGGSIRISGGDVTAQGDSEGAGIGGFSDNSSSVTLTGGNIDATGGRYGAGIGGCYGSSGGKIIIGGGIINASGGTNDNQASGAAGIGGGFQGNGCDVLITNGQITAVGGKGAAGIGSGYNGIGSVIRITGGTIVSTGGSGNIEATEPFYGGAGIGGGSGAGDTGIYISAGTVTATGGLHGAGIGGGHANGDTLVEISDGMVTAQGGEGGAGICGGYESTGVTIRISGGELTATGGTGGAGIGGGYHGDGGWTVISDDSEVHAIGGAYGAGIGGGQEDIGGELDVEGGLVFAEGKNGAKDIGAGASGNGSGDSFNIAGESIVFMRNGTCTSPTTTSHERLTYNTITDGKIGGITIPEGWTAPVYAYKVNSSVPVSSVQLSQTTAAMIIGDTLSLAATVLPEDASYSGITWSTSNDEVASVDQTGKVTAVGVGNATITAIAGGKYDTCEVTVDYVHVSGVTLSSESETMNKGETLTLTATVTPANSAYPQVTWASSNAAVADVDQTGKVTAVNLGEATITATADGVTDACVITVEPIRVASVTLSSNEEWATVGETLYLTADVQPDAADNKNVTWTSSNTAVATVNQSGWVTGTGIGVAQIRATADGVSDICKIVVQPLSYSTYLRGCYIEYENGSSDGIWGSWIEGTSFDVIMDPVINLEMPNCFTECQLIPNVYATSTYQILSGTQIVSNNVPYTVAMTEPGTQTYTIKVIAPGGSSSRNYTVNITREAASDQAELYRIAWTDNNDGEVFFDFFSERFEYNTEVPYESQNSVLSLYPKDMGTTYKVYLNGKLVASDENADIHFKEGINIVKTVLTSSTNIQKTYTFNIYREYEDKLLDLNVSIASVISPSTYNSEYWYKSVGTYDIDTSSYNISLPNSAATVKLSADPYKDNTTLVVKKGSTTIQYVEGTGSTLGGYPVTLTTGTNTITFTVTNPVAGSKTYTLTLTRASSSSTNADLCNLFMNSNQIEGFSSGTTAYQYACSYGVTIKPVVTNTGATYKIYQDGLLKSNNAPVECSIDTSTVIEVRVTASNGSTTKTYTVNWDSESSIAELNAIYVSDYSNSTGYYRYISTEDGVYDYSATTSYYDSKIKISAIVGSLGHGETFAIYKDNLLIARQNISSGISAYVDLNIGLNTYKIIVTSANDLTRKEYTLNLTRPSAPDTHNANICAINLWADDTYDDIFSPDVLDYNIDIGDYDFGSDHGAEFQVMLQDINAVCRVYLNGKLMTTSNRCNMNALYFKDGLNTLEAVVTAADETTQKTYTINIQRAASALIDATVLAEPDTIVYRQGQALDLTGLVVAARHESGYYELIGPEEVTVTGYNASLLGNQTLTMSYSGYTDTFIVRVVKPVSSVTVSSSSITLPHHNTLTLTATVLPVDAEYPAVTWSSSDETVATVSQAGKVTAVGVGDATISATADGVAGTCSVHVLAKNVTSVTITGETASMTHHDTAVWSATVLPVDASYPEVTWSSSDESVVTVDQTGKVTAVGVGEADITVSADGKSDSITVTVSKKAVASVTLNKQSATITHRDTLALTATVAPDNATYPDVAWSSSDEDVATVSSSGLVTGVDVGEAIITATADGKSATCDITVSKKAVSSVTMNRDTALLRVEGNVALSAEVLPSNATYSEVTWTSSDEDVATVDSSGLVTAVSPGSASISAAADGITDTCTVTVIQDVVSVTLNSESETIAHHDTLTLIASVSPSDATYPQVTWSSNDETVASVDQSGKVTAVDLGDAVITATADGQSDACSLTVVKKDVASVTISRENQTIGIGETTTLTAIVGPENATYPQVTWSTSDETVATVDQNGLVSGISPGSTVITAEADGKSDTCEITVSNPIELSIAATSYNSASLSWTAVSGATGYELFRSTEELGTYISVYNGNATSFTNTGLLTGTTYYYKVRTSNGTGTFSDVCSVTPMLSISFVFPASNSFTSIKVQWSAVPGASGYELWSCTQKYGTYLLKCTTSSTMRNYIHSGLKTDRVYYYKVRAFCVVNGLRVYGDYSVIQSISVASPGIVVSRASATSAKIEWPAMTGVAGYEVWRATKKAGPYGLKYTAKSTTSSWTNAGLITGKAYYYKVRAWKVVNGKKVYSQFSPINSVVP